MYMDNTSKKRQGGSCHVLILDQYICKLLIEAKRKISSMLVHCPQFRLIQINHGFVQHPSERIICHLCSKYVCRSRNIRTQNKPQPAATGASELFEAGVPDKIIKETTGHRSLETLRIYEHTNKGQHKAISIVLSLSQRTTFKQAVPDFNQGPSLSTSQSSNVIQNCNVQVYQAPVTYAQPPTGITPNQPLQNLQAPVPYVQTPPYQSLQDFSLLPSQLPQVTDADIQNLTH